MTMRITMRRSLLFAAFLAAGVSPGCDKQSSQRGDQETAGDPVVYTTFYPTTYFAERIAGDAVRVVCPCPEDADPATWMPDAPALAAYQKAGLIVINGASFEKWIEKAALPESRIVDTAKPLRDEFIVLEDAVSHAHGPEGGHSHEGTDGHTWLDPVNAKRQAARIKRAMIQRWPDKKAAFDVGHAGLAADLDGLDLRLKFISQKLRGRRLFSSHPAYNYLARRYAWQQKYFFLEPDELPAEETLAKMKAEIALQAADLMLWESPPSPMVADAVARELNVVNVVFSPCESLSAEDRARGADYVSLMKENLDRLEAAARELPDLATSERWRPAF